MDASSLSIKQINHILFLFLFVAKSLGYVISTDAGAIPLFRLIGTSTSRMLGGGGYYLLFFLKGFSKKQQTIDVQL
ncbi:hypothetical protein OWV82_011257 [Melia azedarach]|uniref:Uncharacterized protein n=1 Tax=Melia azedarach TaxID=155640 RepID=A0ACC1XZ36_MELAZ|nr:hypothetical protein OWV82_011257 [Melia azedarach]